MDWGVLGGGIGKGCFWGTYSEGVLMGLELVSKILAAARGFVDWKFTRLNVNLSDHSSRLPSSDLRLQA